MLYSAPLTPLSTDFLGQFKFWGWRIVVAFSSVKYQMNMSLKLKKFVQCELLERFNQRQ